MGKMSQNQRDVDDNVSDDDDDDVNDDDDGDYDDDQNLLVSSLWYLARVAQEKELVTVETTLGPGTNEKSGFLTKKDSILNIWQKVGEKLCSNLGFADAEEGIGKDWQIV